MASDQHKELANFIKQVHSSLRNASRKDGAEKAWHEHCNNRDKLQKYATCMAELATTFWENSAADSDKLANSRIEWIANYIYNYYLEDGIQMYRSREIFMSKKLSIKDMQICKNEEVLNKIKVVDVGSCYNPFSMFDKFNVLPLDLCPARESVYQCDFLNVEVGDTFSVKQKLLTQIEKNKYDAVIFCFVLEYLPTSQQRLNACCKAYEILKTEGLLMIATPDSNHVGANANIMKSWRYTLAQHGFSRIKYEKLPHMHCMAFRKSLDPVLPRRWLETKSDSSNTPMAMSIPQDFQNSNINKAVPHTTYSRDEGDILKTFALLPECELFD